MLGRRQWLCREGEGRWGVVVGKGCMARSYELFWRAQFACSKQLVCFLARWQAGRQAGGGRQAGRCGVEWMESMKRLRVSSTSGPHRDAALGGRAGLPGGRVAGT